MALLGQWLLAAETSGVTPDGSGNGFHGTLMPTYPTVSPDIDRGPCPAIPGGMNFRGDVGDYISIGAVHTVTNVFTISAWIYPLTLGRQSVYSAGNAGTAPTFGLSIVGGGAGGLEVTVPGIYNAFTGPGVVPANKWSHIACTKADATYAKIYFNGALVALTGGNAVSTASGATTYLGCRAPGSQHFMGGIADVRVYDAEFTAQQIYDLFQVSLRDNALMLLGDI